MTLFWMIVAAMIVVALTFLWPTLLSKKHRVATTSTDDLNVELFRERLDELERDLERGVLGREQFEAARADLEKSLLYDVSPSKRVAAGDGRLGGGIVAAIVTILVPAVAFVLYSQLGANRLVPVLQASAVDDRTVQQGSSAQTAAQRDDAAPPVEQMVEALAARLQANPQDATGWQMLGRSYVHLRRYGEAVEALSNALRLQAGDPDIMTNLAEAMTLANNSQLTGRPTVLLDEALRIEPDHNRALWLRGFAHLQRGEPELAIERWERVAQAYPAGSEEAKNIARTIREARARIGGTPVVEEAKTESSDAAAPDPAVEPPVATGTTIRVRVDIDGSVVDQVTPGDAVFLFARAVEGPRMPLAIVRKTVRDLPFTVVLNDTMSMSPALKLSQFPEVTISARVSKSGNAMRQSGDLEGVVTPVKPGVRDIVSVRIDARVQ